MRKGDWNLSTIDSCLRLAFKNLKFEIKGVTEPYLYFGTWKSHFGWHKEDLDLYSVNFLHHGAPKYWYSIDLCHNETEFGRIRHF